jgi:putative peptidoglycan lipid II flippase
VVLAIPTLLFLVLLGRTIIRVLFEHGKYGAGASDLTYNVLVAYAIALPAYVATEVVTRGLISLRDTRTPLLTNTMQIAGRAAIMVLFVGSAGVIAIPRAFAVMATVETLVLGGVLLVKLRGRVAAPGRPEPVQAL